MIRPNPNSTPDLLSALQIVQKQQDTALLELATGRRVNTPSDDPAASAQVIGNHDRTSQVDSFQKSTSSINGELQTADSTLSSVVTVLTRAISLGVQGANGTLSPSNRNAIVVELQGIQSQLTSLANTAFQGQYLFSGTERVQPYVTDSTTASGVRYDGNSGANSVAIGNGYSLQVNLPGNQIFSTPGSDVFQAVHDLIGALNSNTGIQSAVGEVTTAFDHVTAQRVFYGNGLNQTDSQQTLLAGVKSQLSSQENTLIGADFTQAASDLVNAQAARTATLTAIGRLPPTSLFDHLA
jgi:flagellar hook-associated protein 3 FlgL